MWPVAEIVVAPHWEQAFVRPIEEIVVEQVLLVALEPPLEMVPPLEVVPSAWMNCLATAVVLWWPRWRRRGRL